jgi:hypothetical protein
LSLYPKISAIASGATPIRSAVVHPIERSQQKGGETNLVIKGKLMDIIGCISSVRNFGYIVNKIDIDYSHREICMKVKKDNSKSYIY